MTNLTTKWMLAAAAIALAAGSAAAETYKAEIPFAFRAAGAAMQPGTYVVSIGQSNQRPIPVLRSLDSGSAVLLPNYVFEDATGRVSPKGGSKLVFQCGGGSCVLHELSKPGGTETYQFLGPKPARGDDSHIAEITLTSVKAN